MRRNSERTRIRRLGLAGIAALLLGGCAWSDETVNRSKKLEIGDPAPAFSLPGSDGRTHSLSDHLGSRPVVIAWFPKAFTGG